MEELSKEEIVKKYNSLIDNAKANWIHEDYETLVKFLDLYNELKEYKEIAELSKVACCTAQNCEALNNAIKYSKELELEKEKHKWKPISEYDRKKYDWVLIKYYDGDYECVPEVAEKRADGKWYTSEREIPFEVKYFVDIQELLEN